MNNLFQTYQKLAEEASLSDGTMRSKTWFRKIISSQRQVSSIDQVVEGLRRPRKLIPGMMIVFYYQARNSEKLEYWDRHPLVMINNITRDGWIGENFHYMHPHERARMMYHNQRYNIDAYDKINPLRHEMLPWCNKKYFASNASMVREVPKEYWELALQLPFEDFQKQSSASVWNKTSRKSKK